MWTSTSGDRVVGSVTMHFVGLNPLTQTISLDVAATVVTPQPLPSGFTNSSPATTVTASPAPSPSAGARFDVLVLRCDDYDQVVKNKARFLDCAQAAAKAADDMADQLDKTLSSAEKAVAQFRADSSRIVSASASVNDETALDGHRKQIKWPHRRGWKNNRVKPIDATISDIGVRAVSEGR